MSIGLFCFSLSDSQVTEDNWKIELASVLTHSMLAPMGS
jgi:hypothetical protein